MTADEYWYAPPRLAVAYRDAHKLRMRQQNEQSWLQGMYVRAALQEVISKAIGGKGGKNPEYPKQPIDLGLETEQEKQSKAEREREKIIANLTAWKKMWDKRTKSGEIPSQQ